MPMSVDRSFAGKRILLTGVTGFLGKVVLERLLSEIDSIDVVHVLLRPSARHPDVRVRFEREVLASSLFDSLREAGRLGSLRDKVVCVGGEMTEPRLGLSPERFRELGAAVDIVINGAASVDFREPVDRALAINVHALVSLIDFVRQGEHCRLLQISTCYVHGRRSGLVLEENHAPGARPGTEGEGGAHASAAELLRCLEARMARIRETIPDAGARERAMIDCGIEEARRWGWNDGYTLTKWLGEQLLFDAFGHGGRLCVVRPAVVESTLRTPVPGWVEGVKVADALFVAYARGKVVVFPGRRRGILDLVPADLVANTIVLAAAELLQLDTGRRIYHSASSVRNPLRLDRLGEMVSAAGREDHATLERLFHRPPKRAFLMMPRAPFEATMAVSALISRARRLVGAGSEARYRKAEATRKLASIFAFYTAPNYVFDMRETLALADRFDVRDRARFAVDPAAFDWTHYIRRVHLPGLNRYALKPRRRAADRPRADDAIVVGGDERLPVSTLSRGETTPRARRLTCSGSSARRRPRARPR